MTNDITVCIATIPPRATMLAQALASVAAQQLQPAAIIVEYDHDHTGAAATKNRALAHVDTPFVAYLDDDDTFHPEHLRLLREAVDEHRADVIYSIPHIPQNPGHVQDPCYRYGLPFSAEHLRAQSHIQTTILARTDLLRKGGGFWTPEGSIYDDWGAALGMLDAGAVFYHLPVVTFTWNHHGHGVAGVPGNTSGQPHRW
jgi:glycosyltransferase involved in cell wall biosynthesis